MNYFLRKVSLSFCFYEYICKMLNAKYMLYEKDYIYIADTYVYFVFRQAKGIRKIGYRIR